MKFEKAYVEIVNISVKDIVTASCPDDNYGECDLSLDL